MWPFKKKEPKPKAKLLKVAGRVVAEEDWSPEVLKQIQEQYFRPAAKDHYATVVDVTSSCPASHVSSERVVLVCRTPYVADALTKALPRLRATVSCKECGKAAKTTGNCVVWKGAYEAWDGSV